MKNNAVRIVEVTNKKLLMEFIKVQWSIFENDPHWSPPLYQERLDVLSKKKNPYFLHAEGKYWIAYMDDKAVGRISAQIDELVPENLGEEIGHFGFFDCIDNQYVADALFDTAIEWLKSHNIKKVQGPFSLSINEETGLLVDGFDSPNFIMMGHDRPYTQKLVENYGFHKAKDLWAYWLYIDQDILPPALDKLVKRTQNSKKITIRQLDMSRYDEDLRLIVDIFNDAWKDNWGFIPMTDPEFEKMAEDMKLVIRKELTFIAELDGEAVGMMVTLPNVNDLIRDLNGKLFPFGVFKFLWRLKVTANYQAIRVPLMGVRKDFQNGAMGGAIAMTMIEMTRQEAVRIGCTHAELGWVLEDNTRLTKILEAIGCKHYKTYRVYEKEV